MMYTHNDFAALQALCVANKKWGMIITASGDVEDKDWIEEFRKAAPYLTVDNALSLLVHGGGWLTFDTEAEMMDAYHQTVGDDGPTKFNNYNGPMRVYACTCDPQGTLLTENT